jgi:hypothetical protein
MLTKEMEEVLESEEKEDLRSHGRQAREWDVMCGHAESLCCGMESPNLYPD